MDSDSDNDIDAVFDAKLWIGTNKIYLNVPPCVSQACEAVAAMSPALERSIPTSGTYIPFLLAWHIPEVLVSSVSRNPSDFFSADLPTLGSAPITEFIYLLHGAGLKPITSELMSLSGGDLGWERWRKLTDPSVIRVFKLSGGTDFDDEDDDGEDYEEIEAAKGQAGKKRRPKGPRGANKKVKLDTKKPSKRSRAKK
jgi:hypothetical protein